MCFPFLLMGHKFLYNCLFSAQLMVLTHCYILNMTSLNTTSLMIFSFFKQRGVDKIKGYSDLNNCPMTLSLSVRGRRFLLKVNEVSFQYSDGGRRKGLPMAPLSPRDVTSCHVELFTFSRQCSQHC